MPPWVVRLTHEQLFTVVATVPTVCALRWEAESSVAPSLLSALGGMRLNDLVLGGLAVDGVMEGEAAVASATDAVVRLLRRLSPTLRSVCFSTAPSTCLHLLSDSQWTHLLAAVGGLPHLRCLTICPARGQGGSVEVAAGGWAAPHRPLVRFPFPQLSSVDLGGCALGDVVTLAGLCRSASLDSLMLPLAIPKSLRLSHAAQSTR